MATARVRRLSLLGLAGLLVGLPFATGPARAADPDAVTFGGDATEHHVEFVGGPFAAPNPLGVGCVTAADPSCDSLTISLEKAAVVEISTQNADPSSAAVEDHDIWLVDETGAEVASSADLGSDESISITLGAGTYRLVMQAFVAAPGSRLDGAIDFTSSADAPTAPFYDDAVACLEAVPEYVAPAVGSLGLEPIELQVAVLIDGGITPELVDELFSRVSNSYAPLGLEVTVASVRPIDLPGRGDHEDIDVVRTTASAEDAIAQARQLSGGDRTSTGADVVFVVTDKDIFTGGEPGSDDVDDPGRNYGVVGLADCIGGVRFDSRSFAVAEVSPTLGPVDAGPVRFYHDADSDTIAHEIGHLLGAHHQYANCVEGIPSETPTEDGAVEASPCTLMTNFVDLTSVNFSTVSGTVVRGHAEFRAQQRAG